MRPIKEKKMSMNDEDFKLLASMSLANARLILRLVSGQISLTEDILPLLPEKEGAIARLSELEQLQAYSVQLQTELEQTVKELGLE